MNLTLNWPRNFQDCGKDCGSIGKVGPSGEWVHRERGSIYVPPSDHWPLGCILKLRACRAWILPKRQEQEANSNWDWWPSTATPLCCLPLLGNGFTSPYREGRSNKTDSGNLGRHSTFASSPRTPTHRFLSPTQGFPLLYWWEVRNETRLSKSTPHSRHWRISGISVAAAVLSWEVRNKTDSGKALHICVTERFPLLYCTEK